MQQRVISAVAVVLIGLVPTIVGGPVFAIVFTVIAMFGYQELTKLLGLKQDRLVYAGYVLLALASVFAYLRPQNDLFPMFVALAFFVPLVLALFDPMEGKDVISEWTRTSAATLYLGIATYAAVSLRQIEGRADIEWFDSLGKGLTFTHRDTAAGLGWILLAVLVTWLADTAAYLVGKSVGRTPLLPRVSPNKTVEGTVGGFIAAGLTALICILVFGIDINPLSGLLLGVLLGGVGMIGDLCESLLKRKAGIKDSGDLIPGHGGVLDRIDALVFVVIATWLFIPFLG
jgi:phosphatidate cytidylyltransferase